MGIFKFSDPPYGGSNEVFGKNQNFPLFLNIKLHLKMPVNFNFLNILSFLGGSVPPLVTEILASLERNAINLCLRKRNEKLGLNRKKVDKSWKT